MTHIDLSHDITVGMETYPGLPTPIVEDHLSEALIRPNPTIAAQPDRVDDVLYRLRAVIMGVRSDGLVKANEEYAAWLTGGHNKSAFIDQPLDRVLVKRPKRIAGRRGVMTCVQHTMFMALRDEHQGAVKGVNLIEEHRDVHGLRFRHADLRFPHPLGA